MRLNDLPERWKQKLQDYLLAKGSVKPERLSTSEFPLESTVSIRFEDNSYVKFNYAFVIEALELREVAVFTEHCGYHLFQLYDKMLLIVE